MAQKVDMLETYFRKARLPAGLQIASSIALPEEVERFIVAIKERKLEPCLILFYGLKQGKTLSAGSLLRTFLETQRDLVDSGVPGYFLQVNQLCYQNRSIDRYHRDAGLQEVIQIACRTEFLVIDGIFSYLTQNDDLLLQSIYDARQYSGKTTIVTTSVTDPLACSGSVLFRIFRDAKFKIHFKG